MGFSPLQPPAVRHTNFELFFAATPMGETRRAQAAVVFETQRAEIQAHDLGIGFAYTNGALVADGSPPPKRDPMGGIYVPTTRPGHRLPHAWLTRGAQKLSTLDLVGCDSGFVLLIGADGADGADGAPWRAAAGKATGVALSVVSIGGGQDYNDDDEWQAQCEITARGAILIRPDNHVARRSHESSEKAVAELLHALKTVLSL